MRGLLTFAAGSRAAPVLARIAAATMRSAPTASPGAPRDPALAHHQDPVAEVAISSVSLE